MPNLLKNDPVAGFIVPDDVEVLDVMGPRIQLLVLPEDGRPEPSVMRGTVPPGAVIPLHSHDDPETFIAVSGEIEALVQAPAGFQWTRIQAGDIFHVPGGAKHAFRNQGQEPYVSIVVSTPRMAEFFRQIGTPITAGLQPPVPPDERVEGLLEAAARLGYWIAGPEENAAVGLHASVSRPEVA